ncbi:phytoene desaturase [Myxococcota bacterium]|nr:phytoene desaturase [Myxococcota bacterium]
MTRKSIVIIGAGLGGLSAAISLAAKGYQVTVCEKNSHAGGRLNILEKDGYSFDLGPSIIILPQLFRSLFSRAGKIMEDYVTFVPVEPQWRNFFEDGTQFDICGDLTLMEKALSELPGGSEGYFDFVEYSRRLYNFSREAYFEEGLENTLDIMKRHNPLAVWRGTDFPRTVQAGVNRFVKSPYLREVLGFFVKYVGSSSYAAPAVLNLMLYSQLGWGLWYVKDGMYELARGLERLAWELGVEIRLNTEVTAVSTSASRVTTVSLADGTDLSPDLVVSNLEVIPAYRDLMGEDDQHLKTLKKFRPACSGLVVHLGVDTVYPSLAHHNFFYSESTKDHFATIFDREELPKDPTTYVVSPTVSNPALAPEGHSIIKILPHVPPIPEDGSVPDYDALLERVLTKLERMGLKDLRQHIVTRDVLTPFDIQRLYRSNRGAIYGVVSDMHDNWGFKAPRHSTKYSNLYFTGGSVNPGPGTPMVTLCGQLVADAIAKDWPTD